MKRILAAQKAAEEERARLEIERAERERIAREQDIGKQAEAVSGIKSGSKLSQNQWRLLKIAIAAGQHMHQAATVVHQQVHQAAIAAQPHVQHAVNEVARFGDTVFQGAAREWQRHNVSNRKSPIFVLDLFTKTTISCVTG